MPKHPSLARTAGIRALRVIAAAPFLAGAAFKLASTPDAVAAFDAIALGQWFRYATALLEIAGAALTLLPATSPVGALLLLYIDACALLAQATVLRIDIVHTIVIGAVLLAAIYVQRHRLPMIGDAPALRPTRP